MIICDRCGRKIPLLKEENRVYIHSYNTIARWNGQKVDLCDNCLREYQDMMHKAQSYFMVNKEKPSDIFNTVKYYTDKAGTFLEGTIEI